MSDMAFIVKQSQRPLGSIYPYKRVPRRGFWGRRKAGPIREVSFDDDPVGTLFGTAHIVKIFNAFYAAMMLGYSLNVRLTISWFLEYGDDIRGASKALSRFLKNYMQWCADQSDGQRVFDRPAYIFVHENPGGSRFHTHLMLEIDPDLKAGFRHWLTEYFVKNHRKARPGFERLRIRQPTDLRSQWIWLNYMCKGYDPAGGLFVSRGQRVFLGDLMMFYHEDPGPIDVVRRYGMSRVLHKRQYREILGEHYQTKIVTPLEEQMSNGVLDAQRLYEWRPLRPLIPLGRAERQRQPDCLLRF